MAIGDSMAAAQLCGCARFPDLYGEHVSEAFGQPVWVQNLAVNGLTSDGLLDTIASPVYQSALRDADIITITIGINDINPCGDDRACYETAIAGFVKNLDALHARIDELQADHRHLRRQTAYYNFNIGHPGVVQFGPSFQDFYAEQLASLNGVICAAVVDHGGQCVELLKAFNGPAGDQDAASLLVADHSHPSRTGHQTIAEALAASGYAPLDR